MRGRPGVLAIVAVHGCAAGHNDLEDPGTKFQAISVYGSAQHVSGDLAGTRSDPQTGVPAPAGVPYTERLVDVGGELEMYLPESTMLGTSLGVLFGARVGYVASSEIDPAAGMPTPEAFLPLSMGLTAGTGLILLRRPGLLVALHSSLRLSFEPERLGDTGEAPIVVYAGVRAHHGTGAVRTRVGYDFMPFWGGETRLEHRFTGLISTSPAHGWGVGLRAMLGFGQNRTREGGLNDTAFTLGLEVQR